eukprot:9470038-Pyramimonas_sp.AAC.1
MRSVSCVSWAAGRRRRGLSTSRRRNGFEQVGLARGCHPISSAPRRLECCAHVYHCLCASRPVVWNGSPRPR